MVLEWVVHGQRISFVSVTHICMHGMAILVDGMAILVDGMAILVDGMAILVDGASHGCSLGTPTCNCIDTQVDQIEKTPNVCLSYDEGLACYDGRKHFLLSCYTPWMARRTIVGEEENGYEKQHWDATRLVCV
jgi:hypothetical protein